MHGMNVNDRRSQPGPCALIAPEPKLFGVYVDFFSCCFCYSVRKIKKFCWKLYSLIVALVCNGVSYSLSVFVCDCV